MILITHILIALSSLIYSGFTYMSPTKTKLYASMSLVALTLGSGTYLVVSTHSPLVSSCITGLVYLGIVSIGIYFAATKLAAETHRVKNDN